MVVSPVVPSMLSNISQDNFPLEEPNCICMLFAYMINQQYINIFINVHLLVYLIRTQRPSHFALTLCISCLGLSQRELRMCVEHGHKQPQTLPSVNVGGFRKTRYLISDNTHCCSPTMSGSAREVSLQLQLQ